MNLSKANIQKAEIKSLFVAYQPFVKNYILKRLRNYQESEDLTSEVMESVYKNFPKYYWGGVNLKIWVLKIARNRLIDHYRKKKLFTNKYVHENEVFCLLKDNSSDYDLLIEILKEDNEKILYKAISNLSEELQFLLYYKYFAGLSNIEIADKLNLSADNVNVKLYRTRKKLLEIITNEKNNPISQK